MTRAQQRAFVRDLSRNIAAEVSSLITRGLIPAEWDGHELRVYLASRHTQSASMSIIKQLPRSARASDYRNAVLVNPEL